MLGKGNYKGKEVDILAVAEDATYYMVLIAAKNEPIKAVHIDDVTYLGQPTESKLVEERQSLDLNITPLADSD